MFACRDVNAPRGGASTRQHPEFNLVKRWTGAALLLCAPAVVAGSTAVAAQPPQERITESNNARLRDACAAARVALARDRRITRENAMQVQELRQCQESAGSALPAAWMSARPDSLELQILITASSRVRDARIANVLENIVEDSSKDGLIRLAAGAALTTLIHGNLIGKLVRSPVPGETWLLDIPLVTHLDQVDAATPPDSGLKARLIESFEKLAGSGPRRTTFQKTFAELAGYVRLSRR
jgi:hypothetical protein